MKRPVSKLPSYRSQGSLPVRSPPWHRTRLEVLPLSQKSKRPFDPSDGCLLNVSLSGWMTTRDDARPALEFYAGRGSRRAAIYLFHSNTGLRSLDEDVSGSYGPRGKARPRR